MLSLLNKSHTPNWANHTANTRKELAGVSLGCSQLIKLRMMLPSSQPREMKAGEQAGAHRITEPCPGHCSSPTGHRGPRTGATEGKQPRQRCSHSTCKQPKQPRAGSKHSRSPREPQQPCSPAEGPVQPPEPAQQPGLHGLLWASISVCWTRTGAQPHGSHCQPFRGSWAALNNSCKGSWLPS